MFRTFWKVRQFERKEERCVVDRFYKTSNFRSIDSHLKKMYRWSNPYFISRRYWRESTYGETPLTVLEDLGDRLGICSSDVFIDLGAGRGRGVFFMNSLFGCRSLGIEKVPSFVHNACEIKKNLHLERVSFLEKDLHCLSEVEGTVFYVAWTCFCDELVAAITQFFEQLPKGVKIVTLSEPIDSYRCQIKESFTASFAWGEGEIYIHETL